MAAESLNSQQRLAGLIDRLPLLLDGLRSDGFEIGAGEYLAVHRLLLRLGETGRLPSEVRKLRSFLGPLLCASAEEQRFFARRFAAWAAMAEPRAEADVPLETEQGFEKEIQRLRRWAPVFRWKRWLIGIGTVSAAAVAGWVLWPWISSLRFPTGVLVSDGRISFARLTGLLLAFGILAVVMRDLFRRLLVGRALRRGGVGDGGTFRKASIFTAPEWPRLFSEPMLTEIARAMRLPEPAGGWELDPAETVERSVQCGGRFTPVYSPRRRMPETLALVDRRAWRDHQSAWAEALLTALAERDAPVSVFFFDGDPRVCFSPGAGPRPVSLDHLSRRYPDARLLVFSDGVGPVDIAPFRGSPWRNRAWITMSDPSVGAAEKMAAAGFEVEPASEKGFWDVTAAFNGEPLGGNGRSFGSARPPDTVVVDSMAMRWQESPASKDLEALVAALRGLMDAAEWQWFCACAVYPELRWGLTLHLGAVLTGAEGVPLYSRRRLFTLCRMPWFRHGAMPDWLRRRLMDEPAFRGKSEKRVRRLLFLLLKGVAPSGRLELEVAAPVDRFIPSLMRGMGRRRGGDRALRDPVFMGFMTNSLAVRISRETARGIRWAMERKGGDESAEKLPKVNTARGVVSLASPSLEARIDMHSELPPGHTIQIPMEEFGITLEFVWIPPGRFAMGSREDEQGRHDDENLHEVTLTTGFFMQTMLVTQGQYEALMGNNPSHFKDAGVEAPVENISWNDSRKFIKKLSMIVGEFFFDMPSEAQWEYACRAGTTTPFWTGLCLNSDEANYDGNIPMGGCPKGEYRDTTTSVKKFEPNPWGLYDMHGNVWEWCQDFYGEYQETAAIDPVGPEKGARRVNRGGSWNDPAFGCRSAVRSENESSTKISVLGFRSVAVWRPFIVE